MNKKGIVVSVLFVILIVGVNLVNGLMKKDYKEYVVNNHAELSQIMEQLLDENKDKIDIYERKSEYPKHIDIDDIYLRLRINYVAVERYKIKDDSYENRVKIYLKDKPQDNEYDQCGVYYSPEDCSIDYYGKSVEESNGVFIYDGRPEKVKIIYKSEKICDNWFYFEERLW
ncbi:hypothetical protein D6856_03505 [Butyrivibrio sp. XB500-5]|uniref:hypothetical protein n=1 Tax=Butyrivibrio sp. XB500-5 TaxID=2364880 RepID=UPI000EAA05A4|nr:hypothetical protein [Butyrivibrio sp. XB500-5]RKM63202.1 hypothetical protein D6856_03505 [Butyrivibrio sp. XB500-5]